MLQPLPTFATCLRLLRATGPPRRTELLEGNESERELEGGGNRLSKSEHAGGEFVHPVDALLRHFPREHSTQLISFHRFLRGKGWHLIQGFLEIEDTMNPQF